VSTTSIRDAAQPLLDVRELSVSLMTKRGKLRLTSDVSLTVDRGETLAVVGESGSGKTMTALAIMGLLPRACVVSSGSAHLNGTDLIGMSRKQLSRRQATEMAMVFQDGARSLHPALKVGDQIAAVARRQLGLSRADAKRRAIETLDAVGIARAADRANDYPHAMSGGMCQRAMIAMALVCDPELLIADEPTTALDVTVQAQVLRLLMRLREERALGLLFITHDMGVVAEISDRVAVMYAGQLVESADVCTLFDRPTHPYTDGLLGSIPDPERRGHDFGFIPGTVPDPRDPLVGCRFEGRCPHAVKGRCDASLPDIVHVGQSATRCHRAGELQLGKGMR